VTSFAPIAIVGRGCVLPGALDVPQLWLRVASGADLTGPSTTAQWGLDPARVCADPLEPAASARGGYVRGFGSVWDPTAYALPSEALQGLPEGWRWLMHAAADALREAGIGLEGGVRTGLVLGSLGYATREFADAAAARWLGDATEQHPALEGQTGALRWAAAACGVEGPRVALDAACASGLYALKTACDLLHVRRADAVLAAGLNAADDLFLHVGFTALQALSPSGRSAPLSARADGLLPGEGAAVLVLKRLEDAVANGDRILGIVRGVGLSNDGRGPGLLAPTTAGQQRAIRAAWQAAGLAPSSLQYLECHATGTPVGDREELASIRAVFGDTPLALGSLKAQMGHLITASAAAGLLKICGAFEASALPPAPSDALEAPLPELGDTPFALSATVTPFTPGDTARRAAIDAFGFGGCNAHAILDGPEAVEALTARAGTRRTSATAPVTLALLAADVAVGAADDTAAVIATLAGECAPSRRSGDVALQLRGLGFPPADLRQALPQQLLLLRALQRLTPALDGIDRARLGVFIGADVDPAGARHGFRWRLDQWLGRAATSAERDAVVEPLQAAGVIGTMPNMPANRLNSLIDAGGPGLVLSEGEASGRWALDLAADAIARGELDAAVVGAVDASGAAFGDDPSRSDAVTLLLLMRVDKVGDHAVLARLRRDTVPVPSTRPAAPWGDTGVAGELLDISVAALCAQHALRPDAPALPWVEAERVWHVHGWTIEGVSPRGSGDEAPRITRFAAPSLAALLERVRQGSLGGEGDWRLVGTGDTDSSALAAALAGLKAAPTSPMELLKGWWLGHGPAGEVAWVFTGAAAAYPGSGRAVLRAFPGVGTALAARAPRLVRELPRLQSGAPLSLIDQLQLATLVSQAHALLARTLGVRPDACLGLSSGETNSYLASGAWTDPDALFAAVEESGMYDLHLAGEHRTLRAARGLGPDDPADWTTFRVRHDVPALREAITATESGAPTDVVRLLIVHHQRDAVIGGTAAACRALLSRLGAAATPLGHDLLVHCPELEPFAAAWYAVHHRTTQPITTPRLYANALHAPFQPTAERCAENLLAQARDTAVFDATVERAYADGVRVFVELGPRAACSGWIDEILGDRPHLACAFDGTRGSLRDLATALARLAAAGVAVDVDEWQRTMDALLRPAAATATAAPGMIRLAAYHPPAFPAPAVPHPIQPAPTLMPVLPELLQAVPAPTPAAPPPVEPAPVAATLPVPVPSTAWVPTAPTSTPRPTLAPVAALADTQSALLKAQELALRALRGRGAGRAAGGRPMAAAASAFATSTATPVAAAPSAPAAAPAPSAPIAPASAPAPVVHAAPVETPVRRSFPGPSFSREQLEYLAHGKISTLFGPQFEKQDAWRRQVRMPLPPLLLADRVLGIEGEPATMKTGRIWTETDVREDSWYLYNGRMPMGIMIESGQADLLLISWLGIDLTHPGDRVYRLLGCELTFSGGLPTIGETLHYDIRIDGHARHGEIGLFFFNYDCTIAGKTRLRVRDGQAGLFTDEELAESAGILWEPMEDQPAADAPVAGPRPGMQVQRSYSAAAVKSFADGDAYAAFGDGARRAASHTRTPKIPHGNMQLFSEVVELDLTGGPWGRGYLKAVLPITPDLWFFEGHFHNDPCMPGTLMFDGSLQTMAFYMAALGFTVDKDGWIFEPVEDRPYKLRCRGQCTPENKELVYEVFVAEVHDGDQPMLVADLLCTVDGLKAFHCRRMALKLVPDFPTSDRELARIEDRAAQPVAEIDGFRYGQASLIACAAGHPESAFGPLYGSVTPGLRVPRLPAPPYHFMSRIASLTAPPGQMQAGVTVESDYDLEPDAWYFRDHPSGVMPVCVLVEVALQPCGWLASYVGCAVQEKGEVFFRNLDGKGTLHRPIRLEDGTVRVRSTLTNLSRAGGMTLVSFKVACLVGEEAVYDLTTTFGFFPEAALAGQAGLPAEGAELALAQRIGGTDLLAGLDEAAQRLLPAPMLRMCERVTVREVAPDGRAQLLGEKDVRPGEWFFKAHFYRDPVQPGSLGVEALVQLVQAHLLLEGAASAIPGGEFRDLVAEGPCAWQFRGQVLPESQRVALTVDCEPIVRTDAGWRVRANGSVWVDGRRIYHVKGIEVTWAARERDAATLTLDAATQPWWNDHRPTYTVPVAPGMASLALVVGHAAPGQQVVEVRDLALKQWCTLDRARALRVDRQGTRVQLVDTSANEALLAEGSVQVGMEFPPAPTVLAPLATDAPVMEDPYASGALFHGPAYHRLQRARRDASGADATLRIDPALDDREVVPHILLDAALHVVPHDRMVLWYPEVEAGQVAYPARIERFTRYAPTPRAGTVEVRVRAAGLAGGNARFPRLHVQFLHEGALWAELLLVEVLLPATRLGALPGVSRRMYLRDGVFISGVRLSDERDGVTTLAPRALAEADWLPGTVAALYGLAPVEPFAPVAAVAAREHAAQRLAVHPRALRVDGEGRVTSPQLPLLDYRLTVDASGPVVSVRDASAPRLDLAAVDAWWTAAGWQSEHPELRGLFLAACGQFVRGVRVVDPAALAAARGRPMLFVANHQVAVESMLAGMLLPPVIGAPLLALAKTEHRDTWVGRLALGLNDPSRGASITFVDRTKQDEMLARLAEMGRTAHDGERALLVHVEGTRALRGGQPVGTISAVWFDLAVRFGLTIVPLRFAGGLPAGGLGERIEFPHGHGGQEFVIGRPIDGALLAALRLDERRDRVLAGLAELEPYDGDPVGDPVFAGQVMAAQSRYGLDEVRAAFLLLKARAEGWALGTDGLPVALPEADASDAFWRWFGEPDGAEVGSTERGG
jgi:acyl transferase domain-containing protein/3-hydroxymyristoyl/3-hydroxydecanoyl-(acyl carrier protein) dehydratase/1-acyl-sn-glycerol-3-phosphate acyltransferase